MEATELIVNTIKNHAERLEDINYRLESLQKKIEELEKRIESKPPS